jgi:group I intron endonuclease
MKICGIYKITSPTGRIYVGQSRDMKARWNTYKRNLEGILGQPKLYRSFLKYGVDKHIFEIIELCSVEDLNKIERYWQDFYNVISEGLNCLLQNCDEKPMVLSKETLEKKSASSKGEKNGMYGRKGPLNPRFGVKLSEAQKAILSEAAKGRVREKNHFYGRNHSDETRKLLSVNAKERVGEKNPFYGKNHSDEYKKISSLRMKDFFINNPAAKDHLKQKLSRGTWYTPKGMFLSRREAAEAHNVSKKSITNWCITNCDKKVGYSYNTPEEFQGDLTWREMGWYFIPRESCSA